LKLGRSIIEAAWKKITVMFYIENNNYWSGNNRRLIFIISRKLKEECTLRNGV
jgi:hypothetical protein